MTDNFVQAIPDDELPAFLRNVLTAAQESRKELEFLANDFDKTYDYCIGTLSIIRVMNQIGQLGLEVPDLTEDKQKDISAIKQLIYKIENISSEMLSEYGTDADKSFISREKLETALYKFQDNDFERVQVLINELRTIVAKATYLDQEHRARLLRRLEKLQSELHKEVSDFDKFWGMFGEIGPKIGKFGEDVKPFVDRVKELMEIVSRTQSKDRSIQGNNHNQEKLENESDSVN